MFNVWALNSHAVRTLAQTQVSCSLQRTIRLNMCVCFWSIKYNDHPIFLSRTFEIETAWLILNCLNLVD